MSRGMNDGISISGVIRLVLRVIATTTRALLPSAGSKEERVVHGGWAPGGVAVSIGSSFINEGAVRGGICSRL